MKHNYQQQQQALKHYERILTAKPTLSNKRKRRSLCHRSDPIKEFDFHKNNQKLATKLIEIYHQHPRTENKRPKRKRKQHHHSLINEFKKKQYQTMIENNNLKLIERIEGVKSTISGLDKRQKQLRTYRKLTQKSMEKVPEQSLFKEFRRTLLSEHKRPSHKKV